MDKSIILPGLKKSCVVMHGLAFSFKDEKTKSETLALVNCISEAIKFIEKTESIAGQGSGFPNHPDPNSQRILTNQENNNDI